ncbi:PAAR domain-containing protein [Paraburkholderia megapolitana]|uniref:PAAR domain-containing protein n=1 Tax=Paraburkholderia megapolitana TaxID=420953 RepID=UPI0038BD40E4
MSELLAAARLGDPVAHTPSKGWMIAGLIAGAIVGAAIVAVTGGAALVVVAAIAAGAVAGGGLGEVLGTMSWAPRHVTGSLVRGSSNVFVNGKAAIRAHLSLGTCTDHSGPPQIVAQGSLTVYINGWPASRKEDKLTCSAIINAGSPNVLVGGATATTDDISPEVPEWVNLTMLAVGVAAAFVLAAPLAAFLGTVGGIGGGLLGSAIGGHFFGEGSDGQKWSMLAGGLIGGLAGGKSAGLFEEKPPVTLSELYQKAPAAKVEIDNLAGQIADENGGRVVEAPIKSMARAQAKIDQDYEGDPTRIKDLVRNTIVVPDDQIPAVTSQLQDAGASTKVISAETDPMGYSGVNSTLKTSNGLTGEIQVNSPEMIYAKGPPEVAKSILGEDGFNDMQQKTGLPSGMGHDLYEQYRVLDDPNSPEAQSLAQQSRDYYNAIRAGAKN